jgi:hypothetical protein
MNGILLGMAMLVSSAGASPADVTLPSLAAPAAVTLDLSDAPATSRPPARFTLDTGIRPLWSREPLRAVQTTTSSRYSKLEKVVAIAAGVVGGFWTGGAIGYYVTPKRSKYDDVSGLKGLVIGAPIGAAVGALIGYRLTK